MFGMKKPPILKNNSKSKDSVRIQITSANQKLMQLETRLRARIRTEVNTLREDRRRRKDNPRAVARLKNAYYCLQLVMMAMERMADIEGTYELTSAVNDLNVAMKMVNGLEGKADGKRINTMFLRYRADKMKGNAEAAATGGMREYFKDSIDDLVEDSVLEDLISGKSLDSVLYDDTNTIEAADELISFCDEYSKDLAGAGMDIISDYDDGIKEIKDLIDSL